MWELGMGSGARLAEIWGILSGPFAWKIALLATSALSIALLVLVVRQSSATRQLRRELVDLRGEAESGAEIELGESAVLQGTSLAPIDHIFPREPRRFIGLVVVVAAGCWLLGLMLAPNVARFLTSPEWLFQPLYIAAHLVTLRMFINVYTRNLAAGVTHLDVPFATGLAGVRLILGPVGAVAAFLVAIPFCASDYRYLYSEAYERMGEGLEVLAIDRLMWGIWCLEWYVNALVWVVLLGFLVKNCWTIAAYRFRSPIDVVLAEKHYKPFLHMSAQGATIVLCFSICTVLYLYFTGGAITDYTGLAITGGLLVLGFVPPWVMLNWKVSQAVHEQSEALRLQLGLSHAAAVAAPQPVEHRLDQVLTMLRLSHLDQLYHTLGKSEAKAIMIRLLAPILTIAWQVSQRSDSLVQKLQQLLVTMSK